MPAENRFSEPQFNLNNPDGGRGYIANLFKTVLKRHDYRQYIAEQLAGDFACTMAQHLEATKAREQALQQLLNAADQRIDELVSAVRSINRGRRHEVFVPGDDEPQYRQRKEWVDWVLSLCDVASASESEATQPRPDNDWHMNPCKQGHRDVGASGGVAACNQCDEKIEAATTQEALERWNATHSRS